jgi:hypothetical protein
VYLNNFQSGAWHTREKFSGLKIWVCVWPRTLLLQGKSFWNYSCRDSTDLVVVVLNRCTRHFECKCASLYTAVSSWSRFFVSSTSSAVCCFCIQLLLPRQAIFRVRLSLLHTVLFRVATFNTDILFSCHSHHSFLKHCSTLSIYFPKAAYAGLIQKSYVPENEMWEE